MAAQVGLWLPCGGNSVPPCTPLAAARGFFKEAASPHFLLSRRGSGLGGCKGGRAGPPAWQLKTPLGSMTRAALVFGSSTVYLY